jgi:hypothetical protein
MTGHLQIARAHASLAASARQILGPLLACAPVVVHLQGGHGLDDTDLAAAGARRIIGVD